jgi:hypothetical protein
MIRQSVGGLAIEIMRRLKSARSDAKPVSTFADRAGQTGFHFAGKCVVCASS